MTAYQHQTSLKWAILGLAVQQRGVQGGCGGSSDTGGGSARGMLGGMSLERAKQAKKSFEGGIKGEVAGIVLGVPHCASTIH